jgi:phage terminase Nu1 subunit (DNA packaging protein)
MTQTEYCKHSGLGKSTVCKLVKAGMPLTSPQAADEWRGMSARQRKLQPDPAPYRPPEAQAPPPSAESKDDPVAAYQRQQEIEQAAFSLARDALKRKGNDAGRLVQIHAQACRNLTQARQEVLDAAERERTLVSGEWVKRVMTEHTGAVASLLRAMPRQLAGRIAPHDPEHAEAELDRWVQEVALATMTNTDPWR